jgi:hypothetical protein
MARSRRTDRRPHTQFDSLERQHKQNKRNRTQHGSNQVHPAPGSVQMHRSLRFCGCIDIDEPDVGWHDQQASQRKHGKHQCAAYHPFTIPGVIPLRTGGNTSNRGEHHHQRRSAFRHRLEVCSSKFDAHLERGWMLANSNVDSRTSPETGRESCYGACNTQFASLHTYIGTIPSDNNATAAAYEKNTANGTVLSLHTRVRVGTCDPGGGHWRRRHALEASLIFNTAQ